jgi:trk system potassium uptake protein
MYIDQERSGILIAGDSSIGRYLAEQLSLSGEAVSLVRKPGGTAAQTPARFRGTTITGDPGSIEVLHLAGISHVRAVIASAEEDNVNLMIAQIARDIYHVPIVVALQQDVGRIAAASQYSFMLLNPAAALAHVVSDVLARKEG